MGNSEQINICINTVDSGIAEEILYDLIHQIEFLAAKKDLTQTPFVTISIKDLETLILHIPLLKLVYPVFPIFILFIPFSCLLMENVRNGMCSFKNFKMHYVAKSQHEL